MSPRSTRLTATSARFTVRRDPDSPSAALAQHIVRSHTGPIEYAATVRWAPSFGGHRHRRRLARLSCTASKLTSMAASRKESRRSVLVQLARTAGGIGRHHRPRLPVGQQEASTDFTRATTSSREERAQLAAAWCTTHPRGFVCAKLSTWGQGTFEEPVVASAPVTSVWLFGVDARLRARSETIFSGIQPKGRHDDCDRCLLDPAG